MGRIKSTLIKRTAKQLLAERPELFSADFEHNKKVLRDIIENKKMCNSIAGYITRLKKSQS